jgi:hypothetical protein
MVLIVFFSIWIPFGCFGTKSYNLYKNNVYILSCRMALNEQGQNYLFDIPHLLYTKSQSQERLKHI